MQRTISLFLFLLIGIGSLAGLHGVARRYAVEQRNRRVEMALEYTEVKQIAQLTGKPLPQVLARFRGAGITSLAITEETIAGLEAQGQLHSQQWGSTTTVSVSSLAVLDRIKRVLLAKGLPIRESPQTKHETVFEATSPDEEEAPDNQRPPGFSVPADYAVLRSVGIGLDPEAVEAGRKAGMLPVARINNFPAASPTTMANVLGALKAQGVQTVIFQGIEVLGFRDAEPDAAAALQRVGLNYGQVEFGKQKGDEKLGVALKGAYVRVHSISEAEMATLDENEAIDRFERAARERNIRLCYLRLLTLAGPDPVQTNVEYVEKITRGIARGKEMEFGAAHRFDETGVPKPVFGLIAIGVAAAAMLLVRSLAPISDRSAWLALGLAVLVCAGLAMGAGETGRKLVALLAALVFPTLACLRRDLLAGTEPLVPGEERTVKGVSAPKAFGASQDGAGTGMRVKPGGKHGTLLNPSTSAGGAAGAAVKGILLASAVTTLGIVSVIGLLASRSFIVKANQFLGIKAAHAVPIVLIGLLAIVGMPHPERPWAQEWARVKARITALLSEPTRVGQILITLAALAALALIVARTGNEPGVGVSGVELKFRALLDTYLPVRPRTKEFLIGHPAFVLALALWFRGRRRWTLPLFVVGVIGQVSILNTFCHTHTPLYLSLVRDLTGLVAGTLIGLLIFWLVDRWSPQEAVAKDISPQNAPGEANVSGAALTADG